MVVSFKERLGETCKLFAVPIYVPLYFSRSTRLPDDLTEMPYRAGRGKGFGRWHRLQSNPIFNQVSVQ
jgi:hypothetical protein